jgi:hypothetical protein
MTDRPSPPASIFPLNACIPSCVRRRRHAARSDVPYAAAASRSLINRSIETRIPALGVRFEHSAPPSRMSFAGPLKRAAQAAGRSISTSAARAHGDAPVRSLEPSQPSWTPSRHRAGAALLAARARSPRCSRRCSLSHSAATAQHYVHAPNMYEVTKVRRGTEKSGLCDTVLPFIRRSASHAAACACSFMALQLCFPWAVVLV